MPKIDKFNEDPNVFIFLISTLAGGTGLNLTGANKVVIFGEWFMFENFMHSFVSFGFNPSDPNWSQFPGILLPLQFNLPPLSQTRRMTYRLWIVLTVLANCAMFPSTDS